MNRAVAAGPRWLCRCRPSQRSLGITLVELLVVIALIAILASLLLPALARPDRDKTQDSRVPIARRRWYRGAGDGGVIARMATRDGMQFQTPWKGLQVSPN